jgi:hypothetical protein
MFAQADIDAKVRAKVEEASIPYESLDDDLQAARRLAGEAAARAKVAEAMIPLGITRRPDTQSIVVTDAARANEPLRDDKQGLGFNTETLLAYAAPLAVGAGIGALVGSKYAPAKKKVGPYYGAGIGAVVGLAAFAAIQQFRSASNASNK